MKLGFVVFLMILSFGMIQAQEKKSNTMDPGFKFSETEFMFGSLKQGESVTHEFRFTNTGKQPLIISNVSATCGCTVPEWPKEPIVKGKSGIIKVTFNSAGKIGLQDKVVTIISNAPGEPVLLHLKGDVTNNVK